MSCICRITWLWPLRIWPGRAMRRFSSISCSCDSRSRACVARAGARQFARAVEHALQILPRSACARDRSAAGPGRRLLLHLLRRAPGDSGRSPAAARCISRSISASGALRASASCSACIAWRRSRWLVRGAAVLDAQRRLPQQLLHRRDVVGIALSTQPRLRRAQRQEHDDVVVEERRAGATGRTASRPPRCVSSGWSVSSLRSSMMARATGLWKTRSGSTVSTVSLAPVWPSASAACERDLDRQPGPGMRRQVVIARRRCASLRCWPGSGRSSVERLAPSGSSLRRITRLDAFDAVIVGGLVFEPQRAALGVLRRLGEGDGRRQVGDDGDRPGAERAAVLLTASRLPAVMVALPLKLLSSMRAKSVALVVEHEPRQRAAAMHLGQHACCRSAPRPAAAPAPAAGIAAAGRCSRAASPRCRARRPRPAAPGAKLGVEARTMRSRPIAAGIDRAEHQHQRQRHAQRIGIAPRAARLPARRRAAAAPPPPCARDAPATAPPSPDRRRRRRAGPRARPAAGGPGRSRSRCGGARRRGRAGGSGAAP